jgi:hypothetical protein
LGVTSANRSAGSPSARSGRSLATSSCKLSRSARPVSARTRGIDHRRRQISHVGDMWARTMDERDAVERMREGDIRGLEVLVRAHQVRALRTAYLVTRDVALAQDLV